MNITDIRLVAVLALTASCVTPVWASHDPPAGTFGAAAQPEVPPARDPRLECTIRVRHLSLAVHAHAQKHDGKLPKDMATMLQASDGVEATVEQRRDRATSAFVSPAHTGFLAVPDDVTPEWINRESSYVYIGNEAVGLRDVQDWSTIAIAHLRLDGGFEVEPSPGNPDGRLITVSFLDGHAAIMPLAEARRIIASSSQTLEALRTGGDPPEDRLAVENLALIARAIHAYAKSHEGFLPADLGEVLAFIPETRRTATPAQRARVFLSPRLMKDTHVPADADAEWVRTHAAYVYLGSADLLLAAIPEPDSVVLLYAKPEDEIETRSVDGKATAMVPIVMVNTAAQCQPRAYARWVCAEARKTLDAVRKGDEPPDWVSATHDIRVLGAALHSYSASHEGKLPATLADVFDDVPAESAQARAAIFLSPRAQRTTEIPKDADRAWVAAHATYVYLGNGNATMAAIRERETGDRVLIHLCADEAFRVQTPYGEADEVPFYTVMGTTTRFPREFFQEFLDRTRIPAPKPE